MKNEKTLITQSLKEILSSFKILLTGTPLQNNLHELWALFNFILPDIFDCSSKFKKWFSIENEGDEKDDQKAYEVIKTIHKILKPFLLRRTKADVESNLPSKKETLLKFSLTKHQEKLYHKIVQKGLNLETDKKRDYSNVMMQLRKVCNHPYLFDGIEKEGDPIEKIITISSKMTILDKLLKKLKIEKSQVLIFSQMTRVLDIIEDYCVYKKFNFCRIDGKTPLVEREKQINNFTKNDSDKFIFLLSTRAGGVGLNLATADTVILYDSDWNPQMDLQAMDRAHRIGQTKNVLVYRFICANTIEEKILETQAIKLKLDNLIIQKKNNEYLKLNQMKELIKYGSDKIFEEGEGFKDEDIEIILKRGENITIQFNQQTEIKAKEKINKNKKEIKSDDFLKNKETFIERNFEVPFYQLIDNKEQINRIKMKQKEYFVRQKYYLPRNFYDEILIFDGLKKEEIDELNDCLENGFIDWNEKEFHKFLLGVEKFGSHDFERISDLINTKTVPQIKEYSKIFFKRQEELPDDIKIRLEAIRLKNEKIINNVIKFHNFSYENIKINYESNKVEKTEQYTKEDDKYLIYQTFRNGYGRSFI